MCPGMRLDKQQGTPQIVARPVGQRQAGHGAPGPITVLVTQLVPVLIGRLRFAGVLAFSRPWHPLTRGACTRQDHGRSIGDL